MTLHIGDLAERLRDAHRKSHGILHGYAPHNWVGPSDGYLFDTPHGWWRNRTPGGLKRGHSQRFPDAIDHMMSMAHRLVDIFTMGMPEGAFVEAIASGINRLNAQQRRVAVRILMGRQAGPYDLNTHGLLLDIRRRLTGHPMYCTVCAGSMEWGERSWNHGKFVAVDGAFLMVGGHNLADDTYLGEFPVYDLSVRVDGHVARGAHAFAEQIWTWVAYVGRYGTKTYTTVLDDQSVDPREGLPPLRIDPGPISEPAGYPALWVAHPGFGPFELDPDDTPALTALYLVITNGQHVRLAQQDLGSNPNFTYSLQPNIGREVKAGMHVIRVPLGETRCTFFTAPFVDAVANLMLREGTKLDIVISNQGSNAGYSTTCPPSAFARAVLFAMGEQSQRSRETHLEMLRQKMDIRYIGIDGATGRTQWHRGLSVANHSKFWMVDEDTYYVGSQNVYPTTGIGIDLIGWHGSLQEFGVIFQAKALAQMMLDEYFNLMWTDSKRHSWWEGWP